MNIKDQGIILSVRKYSENSLIVKILSQNNGIYSGFVRGALSSRKNSFIYQIASMVEFNWQARTEEDLGFFKIELIKSYLADILSDQIKLNGLVTIISIILQNVPERQDDIDLFINLSDLLKNLNDSIAVFLSNYIKLEIKLLKNLGYGIDLSKCAVTGEATDLQFVSPKSARAVSASAGEKYSQKLLKLPIFLTEPHFIAADKNDLLSGLELSGFFINKYLYQSDNGKLHNLSAINSRNRMINLIKAQNFLI